MHDFSLRAVGPIGDCAVLRVAGEIDVYTAPRLREGMLDLVAKGAVHLLVDLKGVTFLDSTGLGLFVGCLRRVRAHDGSLTLVISAEPILRVFRITGLSSVLPSHLSISDAVTSDAHWLQTIEGEAGGVEQWCRLHDLF